MKRLAIVIGIISGLVLMAACARPSQAPELVEGPSPKLVAVDSLMWRQPDSALTLLLPWFDSVAVPVEYDLHYAHLLLSELLYKNYYEQTNRAELLQAESYFDSLVGQRPPFKGVPVRAGDSKNASQSLAFLAARAHYMDGVGHYECDSLVPACREYLKALEIMEGRFDEKDLTGHRALFMAYAFSRLTDVYSDLYLHEQAIYFSRRSLEYYQRLEVPSWYTARMLCEIGAHYNMMDQLDSADYYYREARSVLCDTSVLMYRDIRAHQASIECKKNGRPDVALKELYFLLRQSESLAESMVREADIGEIYYNEREYDSAFKYLVEVFRKAPSTGSKKQAAEWLVDICKAEGRDSEILEYASFLAPFATQDEYNGAIKSQCAELYNAFRQKKMEFRHQALTQRNKKLAIAVVGGLLCVLLVLLIIHMRRKHRFKTQLEAQNYAHQVQQAALSSRLRQSNQKVRELKEQMRKQDAVSFTRRGDVSATFNEEPVCRLIMERVNVGNFMSQMDCTIYKEYALSKEQLMDLRKAADLHFNDFTTRLCKAFPELTNSDLDYCCLYLLSLTDADISALMQRAYNTINERSGKLKRVFGVEKTLSGALISFANESQNGDCQDVF